MLFVLVCGETEGLSFRRSSTGVQWRDLSAFLRRASASEVALGDSW